MVKEGQKGVSTYRAQRKAFPINKKRVQEIDLSQFSLKNYYKNYVINIARYFSHLRN